MNSDSPAWEEVAEQSFMNLVGTALNCRLLVWKIAKVLFPVFFINLGIVVLY